MTGKIRYNALRPLVLIFIILNALFITGHNLLANWNADQTVLILGNLFLFGITLFSYWLARRGLGNPNPHAFVRAVYSSILIKLFVCLIAAFVYIAINGKSLNKPAFFTLMGLYLVYTFVEVRLLTQSLKNRTHA